MTPAASSEASTWQVRHIVALLAANAALALGPWLVRLADSGPVSAGFWRLSLALPVIAMLAWRESGGLGRLPARVWPMAVGAGVLFALDLASWHVGIEATRLGNATVFGNAGSIILMVWGLVLAARRPRPIELAAIAAALTGAALLVGGSLQLSHTHFVGDLLCILAGLLYASYILMLRPARASLGPYSLLLVSTAAGAPILVVVATMLGEPIWPGDWTPLIALAMSSQVIGQGLLILSLRHFTPLVIGLALLTQPAISALLGWLTFGETLSLLDVAGMALLTGALAMARSGERLPVVASRMRRHHQGL